MQGTALVKTDRHMEDGKKWYFQMQQYDEFNSARYITIISSLPHYIINDKVLCSIYLTNKDGSIAYSIIYE